MYQNIKEQLKELKNTNSRINPDHSWVMKNKEKMLCQISNNTTDEKNTFSLTYIWDMINVIVPGQMVYSVVRPVVVFLLVGAVATSGWIAGVSATAKSLPGDLGYGMKMATEKTQQMVTAVVSSDERQTELHLEFATRRAKEVKEIVEKEVVEETPQNIEIAIQHLEESIDSANDKLIEVAESQPEKIVDISKVMAEKTKEIKADLKEAEENSEEGLDVSVTKKKVSDANISAVEAVVQVKEDGVVEVLDEDLQDLVTVQIDSALEDVDNLKVDTDEVEKDLKEVKIVLEELEEKVGLEEKVDEEFITTSSLVVAEEELEEDVVSTSTVGLVDVETAVDNVVKKADETEGVKEDLEDIRVLVDGNQILEALQRVKEVSDTTEQTVQEVSDVKKAISDISKETKDLLEGEVVEIIEVDLENIEPENLENSTSSIDSVENIDEEIIVEDNIE